MLSLQRRKKCHEFCSLRRKICCEVCWDGFLCAACLKQEDEQAADENLSLYQLGYLQTPDLAIILHLQRLEQPLFLADSPCNSC